MKWATRPGVHVDRTACAWLIRRFIDPEAEFSFYATAEELPEDVTGFDMRGVELSHKGENCSFETFLDVYDLDDRALARSGASSTRPTSRTSASTPPRPEALT